MAGSGALLASPSLPRCLPPPSPGHSSLLLPWFPPHAVSVPWCWAGLGATVDVRCAEAGVAVGYRGAGAATLLDECLFVFFPLYSFAGWTVSHPTSERGAYKSSSKPRARFLTGPVSVSICLYLFFCILSPPSPWFLLPHTPVPRLHSLSCISEDASSPIPRSYLCSVAGGTPASPSLEHPGRLACMLLAAPGHQKHAQRLAASAPKAAVPHLSGCLALFSSPHLFHFFFLNVGRSLVSFLLFCCNCGKYPCPLPPVFQ